MPEHLRPKNVATPPGGRAARFGMPAILPLDESVPRVTANPLAVPGTSHNTPGQWPKALPAGVAMRQQPGRISLRIPMDIEVMYNLVASLIGRDSWPKEEGTTRERHTKDGGDPPAIKARLLPPTTNTGVLIHSQTEKVTGSPPANQSTFKVNDSTRTVKTGSKPPGPRPLHNLDKGSDGESDSAWGAWGHGEWSADPTIESGKTASGKRIGAVAAMKEIPRRDASRSPAEGRPAPCILRR